MKKLILAITLLLPSMTLAAGGGIELQKANIDITDKASLQAGAKLFVNYCMGCHSADYVRFERIGKDLDITKEELQDNLMFTAEKVGEMMDIGMSKEDGNKWFGVAPPDLSVIARARGVDWLYTYLLTFYLDPSRPLGVNNRVFKDVGMPHVLWKRQGWQQPVYEETTDEQGNTHKVIKGLELVDRDQMTDQEYQEKVDNYTQDVRNLVNFLAYIGEPAQLARRDLGWKVILFLLFFSIFAYLLKREYWRDVH